jgi:hypothetical protein
MAAREPHRAVAAAVALALGAGLVFALWRAAAPPAGPVEVPWDRVACARCRMLVSDPRFAGQLHQAGHVLFFDDPGCLLLHAGEHPAPEAERWFRDHEADRWLAGAEARFVRVAESPMGYGLAARPASAAPDALTAEAALAALRAAAPAGEPPR